MARGSHQLALSLPDARRWGGCREGAGRKPKGAKAGIRHARREHFGSPLPAHVTLRMRADVPSLRRVGIVHEIERTFADGCARKGFRLVHYSLQGNHAHLVVEARDRDALGRGMKAIGARLARAVNRVAGRSGPVLADRYHLRLLPTPNKVRNALRYVLLNARRHAATANAKRAKAVRLDPASSGRWFDGWKRRTTLPGDAAPAAPHEHAPVARARTWLLAVGWRRHGLIDPAEVPG
jgi:REP element-mobilizing transposase RayT